MTEYEAYDLAISSISFNHNLGESILSQIQFWAGVSYALLAITLVAPQRLTIGATVLLLSLYVAFSIHTYSNIAFDMATAVAGRHDAKEILDAHGLSLAVVEAKLRAESDVGFYSMRNLTGIYIPGLFFGTVGYLAFVCRREYLARKSGGSI